MPVKLPWRSFTVLQSIYRLVAYCRMPFVTRFGLGNGKVFRNEGKVTFNNKWFNIGVQDYLPTWRWWITNANGDVPSDAIDCGFTFEDSWYAGSALKLSGATRFLLISDCLRPISTLLKVIRFLCGIR
ncbi:MAG: hypothetical protein V8R52_02460 [Coprobacter fastidiosus]